MQSTQKTFGYKQSTPKARDEGVQRVFSSVASRYDVMNDLMSGGLHRLWKSQMVAQVPKSAKKILDVAGGTGDIAFRIHEKLLVARCSLLEKNTSNQQPATSNASITVCDRNPEMLKEGRARALNRGITDIEWKEGDAQKLPFEDKSFDVYTISFGLRNVTRLLEALKEAHRVLNIGGKFLCLEFSPELKPKSLQKIYDLYSFGIIPRVGRLVTGDADSYQYLAESIRVFPKPEALAELMHEAGFSNVRYETMTFGTVALHTGYKI